ncbi:MAG: TraY domain-containing protein [Dehalococcoidia bacterium]
MASILVRNLDADTALELKERARRNGRSLQAEVKAILERAARSEGLLGSERAELARRLTSLTKGTVQTDSTELIREDRER